MRKILLIDFAYIGAKGGGHSEAYLASILSTLENLGYFVYVSTGNNEKLRGLIARDAIGNCEVVDLNLKVSDRLTRHFLKFLDRLAHKLSQTRYVRFSSLSNLIGVSRLLSEIGEDIPVFFAHTDSMHACSAHYCVSFLFSKTVGRSMCTTFVSVPFAVWAAT